MSNNSNLTNSDWWPNGFIKDSSDGKIKFYPLGTKKIPIPDGVNTLWPDGDALIDNFVYKDGKLVNFIDTAALIINSSGATTMPYDVIDTEFRSIFEGTLSITGPSQMNIKYQTDIVKFVSNILTGCEATQNGGYKVLLDKADSYTIIIKLSEDTISAQDIVKEYVESLLPAGYKIEIEDLPYEIAEIEYIDIVKPFTHDSIITTNALDVELDAKFMWFASDSAFARIISSSKVTDNNYNFRCVADTYAGKRLLMTNDSSNREVFPIPNQISNILVTTYTNLPTCANIRRQIHIYDCGYNIDGDFYQFEPSTKLNDINWGKMIVGANPTAKGNYWRIWRCTVRQNGETTADLVPCKRVSDGTPGLWCKVYKKFYEQSPIMTGDLNWDDDIDTGLEYLTEEEIAALNLEPTV